MKPTQTRLAEASRRHAEAEAALEKHLAELFRRLPMLAGFAVREDFEFDDVSVHSWPGYTAGEELYQAIVDALAELADERPDAARLVRGRTFARAFH
jgi:hypothetical protein